ncbi:hypothetical protein [Pseudorhodoferax sp.]|uniref:hypothetical protein n=1 Tax=Pseudorhodoferax sp. TaxID=1993553 RepID=UPI0039E72018
MSGPKVVRIVTREERRAQSIAIAGQLEKALHRWRTGAQAAGELDEAELAGTLARHRQLRAMLDADEFSHFNQQAGHEIAFLASDLEQRRERASARRASERLAKRRAGQNARTLLQALQDKGVAVDPHVMQILERAARGKAEAKAAEAALAAGFRMLAPDDEKTPTLSQAHRDLAERLATDGVDPSFAQWKAAQEARKPTADDDPRIASIGRQLELLRLLGDNAMAIDAFEQRLDRCLQAPPDSRTSMQLDSLGVELTAAVRDARRLETLAGEAAAVLAELSALGDEAAAQVASQLQAAITGRDGSAIQQAIDAGRAAIATAVKAAAARARRAAVLQGLAKLGYAVHEGMETAWVESGRVVIQKPSLDGYGVEFSGAPDAERLQVRTVALAQERDTARDADAEHLWCGDFARLKDDLALAGSSVVVDKALGVGAVPLKVAPVNGAHASGRSAMAAPRVSGRAG